MSPRFRLRKDRTLPIVVEGEEIAPSSTLAKLLGKKGRKARSRDLQVPHVLIRVRGDGNNTAQEERDDGLGGSGGGGAGEEKTEGDHLALLLGAMRKDFPDMPIHVHTEKPVVAVPVAATSHQPPVWLVNQMLELRSDRDEQSTARGWNETRGGGDNNNNKTGSVGGGSKASSADDERSWNPSCGADRAFNRKSREEHRQKVSMNDHFWEDFSGSEFPFGFDFTTAPVDSERTSLRNTTNQLTTTALKTIPTTGKPSLRHSGKYSQASPHSLSMSHDSPGQPRGVESASYPRGLSEEEYPELRKRTSFAALPVPFPDSITDPPVSSEPLPRTTPYDRRTDEDGYVTDDGVSQILGYYQPSEEEEEDVPDEPSVAPDAAPEKDDFGLDPNFGEVDSEGPFGSVDAEDGSYATDTVGSETEGGDEETEEGDDEDEEEDTQSDYYLETTSTFESVSKKSLPSVVLDVIGDAVSSLLADIEPPSDRSRRKPRGKHKVETRAGIALPSELRGTTRGAKKTIRAAHASHRVTHEGRPMRPTSYE